MEGQVYVPYTGIGGTNMNAGMMPMSVGGSTDDGTGGGTGIQLGYTVGWVFPGGITNQGGQTGQAGRAWGYIFGRFEQNDIPYGDDEFRQKLNALYGPNGSGKFVNEIGGPPNYLVQSEDEINVRIAINWHVAEYFDRVQQGDNSSTPNPEYDWGRMQEVYGSCMQYPPSSGGPFG